MRDKRKQGGEVNVSIKIKGEEIKKKEERDNEKRE